MEIDYHVNTVDDAHDGRNVDPFGPSPDFVWVLEYTGERSYRAYFTNPRGAIDQLAATVASTVGGQEVWSPATATEDVLAYFSDPAVTDTFMLTQWHLDGRAGGGWPAAGERAVPTGPRTFLCVCDDWSVNDPFAASNESGVVIDAEQPGFLVHLGCGRIIATSTGLVVGQLRSCRHCHMPISQRPGWKEWRHVSDQPGVTFLRCYRDDDGERVASPEVDERELIGPARPMPGDAVQLVKGWAGAPAGSIGVIDGMVGEVTGWSAITFNPGGLPRVYRDDRVVRCSGGPGTITADLSELQPTNTTQLLPVWRFRDGVRRAGNDVDYNVRVAVWTWDPQCTDDPATRD